MSNDEVFPEGLEELSDLQDATGKEILDLVRNYGKDGQTRKTVDKLLQKKERLENLWDYFDTNDTQIRDKYSDKPHHEYFTKDFYEKIKGAYENMKADIISRLSSLPVLDANQTMEKPPAATPSGSSVKPAAAATEADKMKMTRALTTRDRYKMLSRHFQSSLDNCSTELKNTYPHMFEIKVKNLVDNFEQLKLVFQRVDGDLEEEDVNIYFHLQKQLEIRLTGLPTKGTTSDHQMAIASLKLPKIELPKFDGCYLKWRQFYDLFKPMILEQPISPAQKLYFLRTNLTGEALSLIQGFPATDSNFEAAWKTLMDRYDNKRLLLCAQLEKLLSQQSASGTASSLRKLHDNTKEGIQALINLGFAAHDWDPIVVHLILKKVDKESRTLFEQSLDDPRSSPSLSELLKFIESRFQTLETITHSDEKRKTTAIAIESNGCVMCSLGNHKIYKCKKFLSLSGADREKSVQRIGICRICLRSGHTQNSCNARGCFLCNGKHNTLLHYKKENKYNLKAKPISNANTISSIGDRNQQIKQGQGVEGQSSNAASTSRSNHRSIYLATALVNVRSACGTLLPCRALLDSGSQIHFVTAAFAQALGIQKHRSETSISGIGGHGTPTQFAIELSFQSRNGSFKGNIEATILAKITDYKPHDSHTGLRDLPAHIQLADPGFMTNQKIDLLIGAELFFDLLLPGEIFIGPQLPLLRNTKLGWIVAGGVQGTKHNAVCSIATAPSLSKIEKLVSRFWECESHDSPIKRMSNEERNCEDFFNSTTQILPSGRFMVSLPFKKDPSSLGASFEKARKRFISLERRLELNNELRLQYTQFLLEYEQLGHMSQIENSDIPQTHYFIPHHCVLKPESSSTALRVVFDCSAKTSSGNSLNDVLGIGPTVQPDLFSIILRFRLKRYAFTADISKMYRQVLLRPEDRAFQLILWRTKNDQPLRTYRLNTLTYGSASAPYLATKCLVQLAKQYENVHVNASQTVSQNIYVDDLLAGADSVSKARELLEEIILLLEKGKFELRKFCSNDENILKNIPDAHKEKLVRFHQSDVIKTLGLIWNPTIDCFEFGFNSEKFKTPEATVTRRSVLSDLARLFDPLGLLSPAIMLGKLFVQDLWKTNFSWDDELPLDLASKWKDYINQFFDLRSIRIPRFVMCQKPKRTELHGFSDSSMSALGACVYVRCIDESGNIFSKLLCSKSRIAPMKTTTIARLELQAAEILVELVRRILQTFNIYVHKIAYYTDSTTVLAWINSPSYVWDTFVANRVAKIQTETQISQWKHIKGEINPADLITRGCTLDNLSISLRWLEGPAFLKLDEYLWEESKYTIPQVIPELRKIKTALLTANNEEDILNTIKHRNSFCRLQRIFSYSIRFLRNVRQPYLLRRTGLLSADELREGTRLLLVYTQRTTFPDEYKALKHHVGVSTKSNLATLTPYFDNKLNLIRVGGRLVNSILLPDAKHQILLPKNYVVTRLLLEHLHKTNLHVSHRALIAISRQQYWILSVGREAKSVIRSCIFCAKSKPNSINQLMGNLPFERVTPSRPFYYTGVDFAGPIKSHYKIRGKIPTKSYLAIFVCFSTKAIHIEVVGDLSTESFINSLKRFIGRRGLCHSIFCDNATNFVGASNQLKELKDVMHSKKMEAAIQSSCSQSGINFNFIPPRSPHFGGLWESAVKSAKNLLVRHLGEATLTYEELTTITIQVEAILNSRPLTPLTSDPNDLEALTPGHFLIGAPLLAIAEPDVTDKGISSLNKYRQIQHVQQSFWKRWSREYLHLLQQRAKWKTESQNIKPNTLVLLKEANMPPMKWKLGRVVDVIEGSDGLVRVANIKTQGGVLQRAIHNLCPLPVEEAKKYPATVKTDHPIEKEENPLLTVEADSTKHAISRKSQGGKITKGLVLISCLFAFFVAPISSTNIDSQVVISNLDNAIGIYFEDMGTLRLADNFWSLYVYYNLTNYWLELSETKGYLKELEKACMADKSERIYHCNSTIDILRKRIINIDQKNDLINGFNTTTQSSMRHRRSPFDFVGSVAHSLFGVLDQEDAQHIQNQIELANKQDQHLYSLIRKQSSIADSTANILRRNSLEVQNDFNTLNTYLTKTFNTIGKQQNEIVNNQHFLALTTYLSMMLYNFERTQDILLDVILDLNHAKINPQIITPMQVSSQLQLIQGNLPSSLRLPSVSALEMLKLITVKGRTLHETIVFEVLIPLAEDQEFQVFNLIPLPIVHNNMSLLVDVTSPYLAVTLARDRYFGLSYIEFNSCKLIGTRNHLCRQIVPTRVHSKDFKVCEMALLNHEDNALEICDLKEVPPQDYWYALRQTDSWIFSVMNNVTGLLICNGQTRSISLSGTGMIGFNNMCSLKIDTMIINGHLNLKTIITKSFVPSARLSNWIRNRNLTDDHLSPLTVRNDNETNVKNLSQEIEDLKRAMISDELPPANIHDFHHYGLSYLLLAITIGMIVFFCRYRKHQAALQIPIRRRGSRFQATV